MLCTTGTDWFVKCHSINYHNGRGAFFKKGSWRFQCRLQKSVFVAKKQKNKTNETGLWVTLHWWNNSKTLLTCNLIRYARWESILYRKLYRIFYIENFTSVPYIYPPEKISTSTVNMECLASFRYNHQSTVHSMNTFPVNLTSPDHARFVILIYSTLSSVHRIKSTSSPATQKKKWQQPRFILQWFKFQSVKGHLF